MKITIALLIIYGVINLWFFFYNLRYHSDITEKELIIDHHEVSLEERERALKEAFVEFSHKEAEEWEEVKNSYTVTDADLMKYTSENAIKNNAVNKLSMTLAHDIIRRFPVEEKTNELGKTVYEVAIKVKR